MKVLKTFKTFGGLTQFLEHDSVATGTTMKFSQFIPSKPAKGALIWLSGLTCTEENFITKAGAQQYAEAHQLILICPDTSPRGLNLPHEHESYDFGSGAGFYVDATTEGYRDHYKMYSYIVNELYDLVNKEHKLSGRISISGHSMGGHGALTIGLKNPDRFHSISAFSPIVHPTASAWGEKALKGYLGEDKAAWADSDATELLLKGKRHTQMILIDQGTADEFLEKQLLSDHIVKAARSKDQPLELNMREGYDHSYYFIATFIESHIAFHAKHLSAVK
ncbi:MAG: S-formylglutathione hydrolase [Proteobacteria bacterium]|nr:MAG: S-formylglutathione hydrolase [Pseudomonadota bacterium]